MRMAHAMALSFMVGAALAVYAGPDMTAGRPAGKPAPLPPGTVPMDASRTVAPAAPLDSGYVTPLAITFFEWALPGGSGWDVCGIRVNTCTPGWPAGHNDVFGIDVGVSGEITGDAAGISCNFFDNICNNFGGIQIGGLYNQIKGEAPIALQTTFIYNRATAYKGIQIGGIWNVATEFRGLQVGLVNHATSGAGLQIGLLNKCGNRYTPIIGIVY